MHVPSLILFMGSEASGLYQYAGIFKNMGIPCGMPYAFLRSTLAAKRMPSHEYHSYFSAIRRFFGDLGLPPIAEAPPDRIESSQFEYYSNLVCRCLLSHTAKNPYLCADHFTALVLPFVLRAIDLGTIRLKSYFFFTNPENEAASLLESQGQPAKLSEFAWRNTLVAAIRNCGRNIEFIDSDNMDMDSFAHLKKEILDFFDMDDAGIKTGFSLPVVANTVSPNGSLELSSLTMNLYEALKAHTGNKDFGRLKTLTDNAFALQSEQNGWQYFDCLDCGELDAHARLLLNESSYDQCSVCPSDNDIASIDTPSNENLAAFLDDVEHKLVVAQNDYAGKLFLHASSLSTYYTHKFDDALSIARHEKNASKAGRTCRKKIRRPAAHGKFWAKRK